MMLSVTVLTLLILLKNINKSKLRVIVLQSEKLFFFLIENKYFFRKIFF